MEDPTTLSLRMTDIQDPGPRSKIKKLNIATGSTFTIRKIRDALVAGDGNIDNASDFLFSEDLKEIQDTILVLQEQFPLYLEIRLPKFWSRVLEADAPQRRASLTLSPREL